MQDDFLQILGELFKRYFQIKIVVVGKACQQLVIKLISPIPALDRAGSQRQMRKSHHPFRVEKGYFPQAVTLGARTHRVVKGK